MNEHEVDDLEMSEEDLEVQRRTVVLEASAYVISEGGNPEDAVRIADLEFPTLEAMRGVSREKLLYILFEGFAERLLANGIATHLCLDLINGEVVGCHKVVSQSTTTRDQDNVHLPDDP
jgi:hypothetical protein